MSGPADRRLRLGKRDRERCRVELGLGAQRLDRADRLGLTTPIRIDGMENDADRAYNAWPERLYVVSEEGRIVYQGGKGPYGFKPEELEAFLEWCVYAASDS